MKKFVLIILLSVFFVSNAFAGECKYTGKINQCKSALEDFIGKKLGENIIIGGSLKDFNEFPCIQDGDEARIFNIAMDENFKETDKQAYDYLLKLYQNKDFCFGENQKLDYFDCTNNVYKIFDDLQQKYYSACELSYEETLDCTKNYAYSEPENQAAVSILGALEFIRGTSGSGVCYKLADTKIEIFKNTAYNGLLLNSSQISKDSQKKYTQTQRKNIEDLSDLLMFNQAYIERISSNWQSKTKHTLH